MKAAEQPFEVVFRKHKIGKYVADLIVENLIVVELKCCKILLPEHQAQLINYLKASELPVGLLVNFGNPRLEYKRLHHPDRFIDVGEPLNFSSVHPNILSFFIIFRIVSCLQRCSKADSSIFLSIDRKSVV